MRTKQIIAGIGAATVLAMMTPAYAGGLGGGAGALGGSMTGGIGGMRGQGAFDGRGAASTSFDRFRERPTPRVKPATTGAATTGADSAQRTSGKPNAAPSSKSPTSKTPSSNTASPSAPPSAMTSAAGAGSIDAQHSRGDKSVALSGEASGSASQTQ